MQSRSFNEIKESLDDFLMNYRIPDCNQILPHYLLEEADILEETELVGKSKIKAGKFFEAEERVCFTFLNLDVNPTSDPADKQSEKLFQLFSETFEDESVVSFQTGNTFRFEMNLETFDKKIAPAFKQYIMTYSNFPGRFNSFKSKRELVVEPNFGLVFDDETVKRYQEEANKLKPQSNTELLVNGLGNFLSAIRQKFVNPNPESALENNESPKP